MVRPGYKWVTKKKKSKLQVIELCAGIGQTSLALKKACKRLGIEMVIDAFCEKDKFATQGYKALHPDVIDWIEDMTTATLKGRYCDILLATTPCQGFSELGKKGGFKFVDGNESAIIWHTFRLIDELERKPKIKEIINWINSKTYCDEDFEEMIKEWGFEIRIGEHEELGETKYIDVSCFVKGAKIWLEEGYKQHTLYRDIHPRTRLEILYLLNALKFEENIFSDEY